MKDKDVIPEMYNKMLFAERKIFAVLDEIFEDGYSTDRWKQLESKMNLRKMLRNQIQAELHRNDLK